MQERHEYKNLIVGNFPVVTISETIEFGEDLPAGTVLGCTVNGNLKPADKNATDGSQNPCGVLLNDVKAENGICLNAHIALTGEFNKEKLKIKNSTVEDYRWALYKIGIFPKAVVK